MCAATERGNHRSEGDAEAVNGKRKKTGDAPFGPFGDMLGAYRAIGEGRLSSFGKIACDLEARLRTLPMFFDRVSTNGDQAHHIRLTREEVRRLLGR